ncbi:MAG: hypothetical protein P8X55_18465 [Desulfosarcinaceae bacterium]
MNHVQDLIESYRRADEEQRIHLFLCHPPVRRAFMEIDMTAAYTTSPAPKQLGGLLKRIRRHLARCCCGVWHRFCTASPATELKAQDSFIRPLRPIEKNKLSENLLYGN